jgi:multidrug resistance efflux pump
MTRRKKAVDPVDDEDLEDQLEDDLDNPVDTPVTPIGPVPPLDPIEVDEEQAKADQVQAVAKAQADADAAKSEVEELEAKLEAAKVKADIADQHVADVESSPAAGPQPCCLPQHDPTLRSARTTKQAQEMVRVLKNNNPQE